MCIRDSARDHQLEAFYEAYDAFSGVGKYDDSVGGYTRYEGRHHGFPCILEKQNGAICWRSNDGADSWHNMTDLMLPRVYEPAHVMAGRTYQQNTPGILVWS